MLAVEWVCVCVQEKEAKLFVYFSVFYTFFFGSWLDILLDLNSIYDLARGNTAGVTCFEPLKKISCGLRISQFPLTYHNW